MPNQIATCPITGTAHWHPSACGDASCELITNLHTKKVLCHRVEVVRISGAATTDCVFCNVIGCHQIPVEKQST